mgnify:CR=1 FL=1
MTINNKEKTISQQNTYNKYIGFDVGTGNLVCADKLDNNKVELKRLRNMFLEINSEDLSADELAGIDLNYIETKDDFNQTDKIIIIGEDAFRFANIFNGTVRRPMQNGILSTKEADAIDILYKMVEYLAGHADNGYCVYSIPARAINSDMAPVLYHEKVLGDMIFPKLGYTAKPLNEGTAVVYSECYDTNYTGIGISFGAGLTNIACVYKGIPAFNFSLDVGGDWIDKNSAISLGKLQTRITRIKEDKLDLSDPNSGNKEERKVKQALSFYYKDLIKRVLNGIIKMFNEQSEGLDIDEDIPIILSGGTSLAKGFCDLFINTFDTQYKQNFPYSISEIKMAKNPLYSVAIGCLSYSLGKIKLEV